MSQCMDALAGGQALRLERARLRADLRMGRTDWREVIGDPPACLGDLLLTEVLIDLIPGVKRVTLETIAKRAHADGLTLTVRAHKATVRTRLWVIDAVDPLVRAGLARSKSARAHAKAKRARPRTSSRRKARMVLP